jgi:hypothetical protein
MKNLHSRAGERGAVSVKTLFTFLIIGAVVFAAIKLVPVYAEQRQVIYDVDDLANKAAVRNLKEDEVKKAITTLHTKYSLPEGSIKLDSLGDNKVKISLGYTKAIDFLVTTYDWKVNHTADGKPI